MYTTSLPSDGIALLKEALRNKKTITNHIRKYLDALLCRHKSKEAMI